jgi:hypothetical protein
MRGIPAETRLDVNMNSRLFRKIELVPAQDHVESQEGSCTGDHKRLTFDKFSTGSIANSLSPVLFVHGDDDRNVLSFAITLVIAGYRGGHTSGSAEKSGCENGARRN